jgi:fatty-acyl-CoA synthase
LWTNGTPENIGLVVVPMFHITGMVIGMHASVYGGTTMVIMPRWDRELAGRLISRWKVTHWVNIPTMVIDLLASPDFARHDLSQPDLHRRRRRGHAPGGGAATAGRISACATWKATA